jgi:hypothetical protein
LIASGVPKYLWPLRLEFKRNYKEIENIIIRVTGKQAIRIEISRRRSYSRTFRQANVFKLLRCWIIKNVSEALGITKSEYSTMRKLRAD